MPLPRNVFWPGVLFLLGTAAAQAHDVLQSSTNIWLRPDKMEVSVVMARVPSRALVDNAPEAQVSAENFADTYHALLLKSAPAMLEITLDGKKIEPRSMAVSLPDETDVQFDFVYDRPANGRQMQVTMSFLKKMAEGYIDSLGMNEGKDILGYGDQSIDDPTWEIKIGDPPLKPPSEMGPPPPPVPPTTTAAPSPSSPATTPPSTTPLTATSSVTVVTVSYRSSFLIATIASAAVLLLLIIFFYCKKTGR